MDTTSRKLIDHLMRTHNVMTLATVRPDGYPQATTVGYVNDGLTLYVGVGDDSQKVQNIRHCDKVSLTIDRDEADWDRIQGLSMAARAAIVTDAAEIARIEALMTAKFPQVQGMADADLGNMVFLRITPEVISVLDYTRGFGHTELVRP